MCTVCTELEAIGHRVGNLSAEHGAVAQFGRAPAWHAGGRGIEALQLHSPWSPSSLSEVGGYALGGLVAGEGCFCVARTKHAFVDGRQKCRFVFQIHMASRDRALLTTLRAALGFGSVNDRAPRSNELPSSTLTVGSRKAHMAATIPFMERFLLPCAKRSQFELWRDEMLAYDAAHPRRVGRSTCSVEDCPEPVRGRGLCRRHYYRATGY